MIEEVNKNLPANVYIPIRQETTNLPDPAFLQKFKKNSKLRGQHPRGYIKERIAHTRMHRVLRISTDNAFCLHSKERVPYHIIIEVAYEPEADKSDRFEEEKVGDSARDNPFDHDKKRYSEDDDKAIWPVKKLKNLANAAQKKRSGNKNRKSSLELEEVKTKGILTSRGSAKLRSKTNLLSRLPKKKFFGERGNSDKLIEEQQQPRENYNQTVLISTEKSLGDLKLGNCKPADTHSDGAIEAKDI